MNGSLTLRPASRPLFAACLVLAVFSCLAAPAPARAARPAPAAVVAAAPFAASDDSWGVRKLFSGLNTRARIIQVAIACMCLGLFILMRKLTP